MAVYQPSGVLCNGHSLVGVGERGELMSFYYPHIDFPQNLSQGMPAFYLQEHGKGRLEWTFEDSWSSEQHFLKNSNILQTVCRHHRLQLEVVFTDFVLPQENVLVRLIEAHNTGTSAEETIFYQYLDLQLGEMQEKNGLRWVSERGEFIQYWRNVAFAIGGDSFDQFGCGKAGPQSSNSAKLGMVKGQLNSNLQEIGDVDLAVGWKLRLEPGKKARRMLLISAAPNEQDAISQLENASDRGYTALLEETQVDAGAFLASARTLQLPQDLEEGYGRGLLVLRSLFDLSYGAFLAAPEFDPAFERSGGYGYCWPRDAAEVVLALEAVGLRAICLRFLEWARHVQEEDGGWEQRYWLNGERGPAWCTLEGHMQIDQVGSMLLAIERVISSLPFREQKETLARLWPMAARAAEYLTERIDEKTHLHRPGCDLWEIFQGSFTYTNASVWAGLRAAAALADVVGENMQASKWREASDALKSTMLEKLWNDTYFVRGLDSSGQLDMGIDSSILGLIDPFQLLHLENAAEREMAEACVETIEKHLARQIDGGKAIARFEGDQYLGGSVGGVNTLWMSRVLLRLALVYQEIDSDRSKAYRARALEYIHLVKSRATKAGMLPELIGGPVSSHWAAPHGWTTASYIVNMLLLDCLAGNGNCK